MIVDEIAQIVLYENFGDGYPLDKESRKFHGLIYFVGGEEDFYIDGRVYHKKTGDIMFLPQYSKYRVELKNDYLHCYVIDFYGKDVGEYVLLNDCSDMMPMFEQIEHIWRRHREDEYFRLECTSIIYKLFAEVYRRRDRLSQPLRKVERLSPVIEAIHENYISPDLRVSDLAALIGVGERCLNQLFNEVYGCSPKKYISKLRIDSSKGYMLGRSTIGEIAHMVGFNDVYHFSSFFKKECGVTPTEYRYNLMKNK